MKIAFTTLAATALLCIQPLAFAADDYDRPDNTCGRIHADKSGNEKDAAIAHCIQERYKGNRATGSQEVQEAKRKQCNAGSASSDKEKKDYMNDCSTVEKSSAKPKTSDNSDPSRERKKLGKGGLDNSGETHSGSSTKPASPTNTSGGVNTGNSESPRK
ncbi:hypothetical protein [Oxalicibacterium faecigallinarum]|uniref:PsiF repeat-containing protein n=1 Tax=Oxalicibacterium faecigallinarum TaxID=573741 RepID=A0A8J3AQG5_9BURK|nr:hypothetical protein [Oxalicibacterium faecigallinarum]GGI18368.1 hypothetical protein GCM10008066_13660 [Oxalicibacterium faecigallinarum]